jgi:hypothetical protein
MRLPLALLLLVVTGQHAAAAPDGADAPAIPGGAFTGTWQVTLSFDRSDCKRVAAADRRAVTATWTIEPGDVAGELRVTEIVGDEAAAFPAQSTGGNELRAWDSARWDSMTLTMEGQTLRGQGARQRKAEACTVARKLVGQRRPADPAAAVLTTWSVERLVSASSCPGVRVGARENEVWVVGLARAGFAVETRRTAVGAPLRSYTARPAKPTPATAGKVVLAIGGQETGQAVVEKDQLTGAITEKRRTRGAPPCEITTQLLGRRTAGVPLPVHWND